MRRQLFVVTVVEVVDAAVKVNWGRDGFDMGVSKGEVRCRAENDNNMRAKLKGLSATGHMDGCSPIEFGDGFCDGMGVEVAESTIRVKRDRDQFESGCPRKIQSDGRSRRRRRPPLACCRRALTRLPSAATASAIP